MNIRDLRYLVAVAEHRHFGQAAESCYVSQPTLSQQVKKMEHVLGVTLFDRGGRRVQPTAAGEAVLAHARRLLAEHDALREAAKAFREPGADVLNIGVFPTLAPYFLPSAVPELHRRYPEMKIRLVEEKTQDLLIALDDGGLDVALLALPISGASLATEVLFDEPFLLAVHSRHALADRQHVQLADLNARTLLLLDEGHCLRDQALAVCDRAGAEENQTFRATSMETLKQMIAVDESSMTLVPSMAARGDDLRYIPFADAPPSRSIGMAWRKQAVHAAFYHEIADSLRQFGQAQMGELPGAP